MAAKKNSVRWQPDFVVSLPGGQSLVIAVKTGENGLGVAPIPGTGVVATGTTPEELATNVRAALHEEYAYLLKRKKRLAPHLQRQLTKVASLLGESV